MAAFETLPVARAVVCFGDSITFMAAARADRGYPSILDEALFARGVSVGNYGISGGGFQNARDAYDLYHRNRGLWGASVLVGVNDIAAGLTSAATFDGINSLVNRLLDDGLRVVLSTILPWKNGGGWTAANQTKTEEVNASIRALAGTTNLRVVDGYAEFGQVDDPTLLQRSFQELIPDSLHLGSYGAQAFSRLVEAAIIDLLDEDTGAIADNPARALASYLAAGSPLSLETPPGGSQALSFAAGGNLTTGPMRAAEGLVGEFHVSVLNSGGVLTPYMGTGDSLFESAVTVRVRSRIDSYSQGEAVARACLRRVHLASLAGYVSCLVRDAEPVYQGLDENGHHGFVFTVDVTIKR